MAGFRVLVVEDEPNARGALRDLLEIEGYVVETVARGDVALVRQCASPADLLLTDIGLPGLDGISLAHAARAATGCAVLLMTGSERTTDDAHEFDTVMKPIDFDRLLARIARVATKRGG